MKNPSKTKTNCLKVLSKHLNVLLSISKFIQEIVLLGSKLSPSCDLLVYLNFSFNLIDTIMTQIFFPNYIIF